MDTTDQYSFARIVDRQKIVDKIHQWCRAIDRQDMGLVRSVFHQDATDDHTAFKGDVDGLIQWISERHRPIPFSMHMVGNILVEFASNDVALVETYVHCIQRYPPEARASLTQLTGCGNDANGGSIDSMSCSRYVDVFERRQEDWRISERTVVIEWKSLYDVPANAPRFQASGFKQDVTKTISYSPKGDPWELCELTRHDCVRTF